MLTLTDSEVKTIAERFIRWPLPSSIAADPCATSPGFGRTGTNLLTVAQAEGMVRFILDPEPTGSWCPGCQAYRSHHGDPDSIHLHLCDVCNGVVDY